MIQYHLIESWERSSRTLSGVRGALRQSLAEPPTRLVAGVLSVVSRKLGLIRVSLSLASLCFGLYVSVVRWRF